MSKFDSVAHRVPINENNPSIICNDALCKKCQLCKKACINDAGVMGNYDLEKTGDRAICINCGACITACPFNAISEVYDTVKVLQAIKDETKKVVFMTAPAVRVSLGEAFGLDFGTNVEGKMVKAIRDLGADYVLDVVFGADLTIMEEAAELVHRIKTNHNMPMFTSCCPAWVKYCETFFPNLIPHLSSCKSPIAMQATLVKTYFAQKMNLNPADIVVVAVAPCVAKKAEGKRPELSAGLKSQNLDGYDCDITITTRELAQMIKDKNIDFANLDGDDFDSLLGTGSGAGMIFGNTGGVMEAALRTAFYLIEGRNMTSDEFPKFQAVRGFDEVKEASIKIGGKMVHVAVLHHMGQISKIVKDIELGNRHYDFIEVMACKGGCAGGAGQVKVLRKPQVEQARVQRNESIYNIDSKKIVRLCHENPVIKQVYSEYLENPNSHKAHELLHTKYVNRSTDLNVEEE